MVNRRGDLLCGVTIAQQIGVGMSVAIDEVPFRSVKASSQIQAPKCFPLSGARPSLDHTLAYHVLTLLAISVCEPLA